MYARSRDQDSVVKDSFLQLSSVSQFFKKIGLKIRTDRIQKISKTEYLVRGYFGSILVLTELIDFFI